MEKRIVIVDEDLATRMTLEKMLTEDGHTVMGAGKDGFEAIELCKTHTPDLLIINPDLPVLSGIIAARKAIAENHIKSVIYICDESSEINRKNLEKTKSKKTVGWISKPIHKEALHATIWIGCEQVGVIEQLEKELETLNKKLLERKKIERAKGVLMQEQLLSEPEAYKSIQRLSMQKRTSMAEIADLILLGIKKN